MAEHASGASPNHLILFSVILYIGLVARITLKPVLDPLHDVAAHVVYAVVALVLWVAAYWPGLAGVEVAVV